MSLTIGNAAFMQLKDAKKATIITGFKSSNETDKNNVSNFSPKSVFSISKSSSFLSLDDSDFESLSLCNQFSSNLNLSRKSSSFSSLDEIEDILIPPIDLDEEDSELIFDEKEQDLDIFGENFPSPPFNCKTFFTKNSSKDFEFELDEPIFWPYDYDSYKISDLEKFLSMSPRKNEFHNVVPVKKGLNPIRISLHQKNNPKKVASNPKSTLNSTKGSQKAPNVPTKLGKSSNSSKEFKNKKSVKAKGSKVLKEGDLQNLLEKEISIENLIGLHEFDGHEGIEEFGGKSEISLSGSPWETTSMMESKDAKLCARNKSNLHLKKISEEKFGRF